jgi:hypothetical protein
MRTARISLLVRPCGARCLLMAPHTQAAHLFDTVGCRRLRHATESSTGNLLLWPGTVANYCNFAYSALACFRMGISGSASFQRVRTF